MWLLQRYLALDDGVGVFCGVTAMVNDGKRGVSTRRRGLNTSR